MTGEHLGRISREGHQAQRPRSQMSRPALIGLAMGLAGVQIIWTVIMGQGSLYLSSLGIPKHAIFLIWLAGPLSGALIQPYISVRSDRSRNPRGRRSPYIWLGTLLTVVFMTLLPCTEEISQIFANESTSNDKLIVVRGFIATALIWALKVSIQPIQMGLRALVCEACPRDQTVEAAAYASTMSCVGSIVGYTIGLLDLPDLVPIFGNTQFKCLCFFAASTLTITVSITLSTARERASQSLGSMVSSGRTGIVADLQRLLNAVTHMPENVKKVCQVQFFAWLGWFPFLYYITTYLAWLNEKHLGESVPPETTTGFQARSVRLSTLAMVCFSCVGLVSAVVLRSIVSPHRDRISFEALDASETLDINASYEKRQQYNAGRWVSQRETFCTLRSTTAQFLTLPRVWASCHFLAFAVLLASALTNSALLSSLLVSVLGISWAATQWVPFAIISLCCENDHQSTTSERTQQRNREPIGIRAHGQKMPAGTALGLCNMAIASPQIVAALGSSAMVYLVGPSSSNGVATIGWLIRIWGAFHLLAGWSALGIKCDEAIAI